MDTSSANASESRRDSSAASESQDKQEVFSSGPLKRVVLADADSVNSATLLKLWKEQDRYLDQLEAKFHIFHEFCTNSTIPQVHYLWAIFHRSTSELCIDMAVIAIMPI